MGFRRKDSAFSWSFGFMDLGLQGSRAVGSFYVQRQ